MQRLFSLDSERADVFPDINQALREPNGLLAVGGDLSTERIINAYCKGIFPWFLPEEAILWWSPDPRMVLKPNDIHISKNLAKLLRQNRYQCSINKAFDQVITHCGKLRENKEGTWISDDIKLAFNELYELGWAHSFEVWENDQLIGGLYGLAIGKIFFGESMFSLQTDASKIALTELCKQLIKHKFQLIDCQVYSQHLSSMGAKKISRDEFVKTLETYCTDQKKTQFKFSTS